GGTIYFAAGIWPSSGIYIYALDAETGKVRWCNSEVGLLKGRLDDHNRRPSPSGDTGLAPQGYFAISGDRLIVPSSRAQPGFLDRNTGKLAAYGTGWGGRVKLAKGCWYVAANSRYYVQSGDLWSLSPRRRHFIDPANFKGLKAFRDPVITEEAMYYSWPDLGKPGSYREIVAEDLAHPKEVVTKDKRGREKKRVVFPKLWGLAVKRRVHIRAGARLYAGAPGSVAAIDMPAKDKPASISWTAKIEGTPSRMIAAGGRLFVVTQEGQLYAFGPEEVVPERHVYPERRRAEVPDGWTRPAEGALSVTRSGSGYCLVLGFGSGRLVDGLVRLSGLHVIVVEPDPGKVADARRRLAGLGLYGTRVAVLQGDASGLRLPPYFAELIVTEDDAWLGKPRELSRWLRPYGGVAYVKTAASRVGALAERLKADPPYGIVVSGREGAVVLSRPGPLPEAADWTHAAADAGNTYVSADAHVKVPLAMLWFGGSMDEIFPDWDYTHSRYQEPLVTGGRIFIRVGRELSAADIYTGRRLWWTRLPPVPYKNFWELRRKYVLAADEESIYATCGRVCLRLSAESGRTTAEIKAPPTLEDADSVSWRDVRVCGERVILVAPRRLVGFDKKTNRVVWTVSPEEPSVSCVVGDKKVFYLSCPAPVSKAKEGKIVGTLVAAQIDTGAEVWRAAVDVRYFKGRRGGIQWPALTYSAANDVLLCADQRIRAFAGKSGKPLWSKELERQRLMLHPRTLFTEKSGMFDPLTGKAIRGRLKLRGRGCTSPLASTHLITGRDAHVYYVDLESYKQTFVRGLRPGCTNSLIPAGGLVNAPNFARGCTCNYAIYTSTAFVHAAEVGEPGE
ncbi:MAG: outer membrane protein assembly factor BamB family protein, partial [Planctomycetota bacterium]